MTLSAIITSDIDTLASIYKGNGCTRPGGYTYAEMQIGLENFSRFLEKYHAKATLFMVGQDFLQPQTQGAIKAIADEGHEIANHTHTHPQGFRLLSSKDKEREIVRMEQACYQLLGKRPVGFRSPGWNIGDDAIVILKKRGYLYDSSVFPTTLMPLLKFMHWRSMAARSKADRTTMGQMNYMLAPVTPYTTARSRLAKKGTDGILEYPVTVTPVTRIPFFATFLLATGLTVFRYSYRMLKAVQRPIQFQFHLSDFVDYNASVFRDQVPVAGMGQYVPQALYTPLDKKLAIFQQAVDLIAKDYSFITMQQYFHDDK